MASNDISVAEFVEIASFLYGANWCSELSEKLGIRSESLILTLGGGGTVLPDLSDLLCDILKDELGKVDRRVQAISKGVDSPLVGRDRSSEATRRVRRLLAS